MVEHYSTDMEGEGEEELKGDGEGEVPKISINAAIQALETLKLTMIRENLIELRVTLPPAPAIILG